MERHKLIRATYIEWKETKQVVFPQSTRLLVKHLKILLQEEKNLQSSTNKKINVRQRNWKKRGGLQRRCVNRIKTFLRKQESAKSKAAMIGMMKPIHDDHIGVEPQAGKLCSIFVEGQKKMHM